MTSGYVSNDSFLYGDTFLLRPWKIEDAEWYVTSRDEAIFNWTTENRDLTVAQTEASIRDVNRDPDSYCFAIVDQTISALVGNIALVIEEKIRGQPKLCIGLRLKGGAGGSQRKQYACCVSGHFAP